MLKRIQSHKMSFLPTIIFLVGLVVLSNSQPVLMTEQVGQLIFQQHKYFLIYVYDEATPTVLQMFSDYCHERTNCAVLNSTVEEYLSVRKFIGKASKEFFLILNVPFQKKYLLPVDTHTMTKNDLINFEKRYQQGTLEPFYATQPTPLENSPACQELVGKTFSEFLKQAAVLKVVYTYTKHEACAGCMHLLKDFQSLAEKMHNKDVLIFGYVDVYSNDIPKIPQPIVPHFYIYQGSQIVKQIDEVDFQNLPQAIKKQVSRIMIDMGGRADGESESSSSGQSGQSEEDSSQRDNAQKERASSQL